MIVREAMLVVQLVSLSAVTLITVFNQQIIPALVLNVGVAIGTCFLLDVFSKQVTKGIVMMDRALLITLAWGCVLLISFLVTVECGEQARYDHDSGSFYRSRWGRPVPSLSPFCHVTKHCGTQLELVMTILNSVASGYICFVLMTHGIKT